MTAFIFFLIGLMLGGCVGITTMCLVQINRIHQFDNGKEQVKDEKDC